ncbi:hypothetical protein PYW07_014634 [Mythimna separata]|uniref:Serpin domain-containing protein n=1 Tax=Mythimna separata TaxID=271217 RepID=A0AAD7Z0Z1_MYTSE|nr:hypothetical protein PYW07_014634 [Mythimna separata]
MNTFTKKIIGEKFLPQYDLSPNRVPEFNSNKKSHLPESQPVFRQLHADRYRMPSSTGMMNIRPFPDWYTSLPAKPYTMHYPGFLHHPPRADVKNNMNTVWTPPLHPHTTNGIYSPAHSTQVNSSSIFSHNRLKPPLAMTTAVSNVPPQMTGHKNMSDISKFTQSLDHFERQFYKITFTKLIAISPADRQENGMSFVQSGLFLLMTLMALWKEVDPETRAQIDHCIGFNVAEMDSVGLVRHFMATLPTSSDKLKFRRSSRLMLWPSKNGNPKFQGGAAAALMLQVEQFNGTETSEVIATILNHKVELDSEGAIHDTFEEDDVSGGVSAVLVSTLYVRARWRAAPTVLNGTAPFRDAHSAPGRTVRMIRINDVMKYADLTDWDAQVCQQNTPVF